jgi:N-acetylmuramoyl-L-alanine amidase
MYRYRHLYRGDVEGLDAIDARALCGKVVMLDPGHGGRFHGAVGPGGLREKDVNLEIAKILQGLLKSHGARVILSRERDTELSPILKEDLKKRVDISNENNADLFISLHHNADLIGSQTNRIETYYAMEGMPSSIDLARCIHLHLVKNLGIKENRLIPGNFRVLRGNNAVSVLLEPSYISNEYVEWRLRDPDARRLEAKAIFLGVVDYLSRGMPMIEVLSPERRISHPYPRVTLRLKDGPLGEGIDPLSIRMRLNGEEVDFHYDDRSGLLTYIPSSPFPNGSYLLEAWVRNYRGNASKVLRYRFVVDCPPSTITFHPSIEHLPSLEKGPFALEVSIYDEYNNRIADGRRVEISSKDAIVTPSILETVDGKVITYIERLKEKVTIHVRCGDAKGRFEWATKPLKEKIVILNVRDAITRKGISKANLSMGERKVWFNRDGYLLLKDPPQEATITARGYVPKKIKMDLEKGEILKRDLYLLPIFGGLLHGRRIAVDPQHGGIIPGASNRFGLEEKEVNLEVANYLFKYLKASGAIPILTRTKDEGPSDLERLMKIEASSPEILIIIGHGEEGGTYVSHYPGSKKGRSLALCINRYLNGRVSLTTRYLVTHSSMPAVYVHPSSIMDLEGTLPYDRMRLDAYRIFAGVVDYFLKAEDKKGLLDVEGRVVDAAMSSY